MYKLLFISTLCGFILSFQIALSQTLKKKIDPTALQAKIDSVRISGQLTLNFYFKSSDFSDYQPLSQKQIDKKIADFEKKIKIKPTANLYHEYGGFLAQNVEKDSLKAQALWRKALDLYKQEIEKNPKNGEAFYGAGILSMKFNYREDAYDYLTKSTELMPDSAKTWAGKGAVLLTYFNNYTDSKSDFEKAINLDLKNIDNQVFFLTCSLFEALSKLGQSGTFNIDNTYLQKLIKLEPNNLTYQSLIKISRLVEVFYQAMYKASLNYDSKDEGSFFKYFDGDNNELKSLRVFIEQTISKRKNNLTMLYNALALNHLLLKNNELAIAAFEKAIQSDKNQKTAFDNLAFVYAMQKMYQESVDILNKKDITSLLSSDYEIKAALINRMKKKSEALEVLEAGLIKFPQSPGLKISKGILLCQLKKVSEGQALLQDGLRNNPNDSIGQYFLGLISWQLEDINNAFYALSAAAALGDNDAKNLLDEYFNAP
jgi:tetratricopeptide (TPR) repeat protein